MGHQTLHHGCALLTIVTGTAGDVDLVPLPSTDNKFTPHLTDKNLLLPFFFFFLYPFPP